MIINFLSDVEKFSSIARGYRTDTKIVDFTGVLIPEHFSGVIQPRKCDVDNEIELRAISNYISFCGDVSNSLFGSRSIRSWKVCNVPIYWLTDFSEKHDSFHWGQSVFFMRQFLQEKPQIYSEELAIDVVLPGKFGEAANLVRSIVESVTHCTCRVICIGKKGNSGVIQFGKTLLKNLWLAVALKSKLRAVNSKKNSPRNIFIAKFSKDAEGKKDLDLDEIYKYSDAKTPTAYFPFVLNYDVAQLPSNSIDSIFFRSFPSFYKLLKLAWELVIVYYMIRRKRGRLVKIGELTFTDDVIQTELMNAIAKTSYYINYLWLMEYFKSIDHSCNILYSDEFYVTGRVISLALINSGNKKIRGYGVQHGLLLRNHTVYTIGDKELLPDAQGFPGMPIPGKFVVWGNYFKSLFLSYNSLSDEYIIVGGNMKYMGLTGHEKSDTKTTAPLKLLWCTTLPSHFKAEYHKIRQALLEMPAYTITFRLHPAGHIDGEMLWGWLDDTVKKKASFSKEINIFDDISKHDLVLCTIFSTTFFDALVMNKTTCRITSDIAFSDFSKLNLKNLYDIVSSDDLSAVIKRLTAGIADQRLGTDIRELCSFDASNWDKVLFANCDV